MEYDISIHLPTQVEAFMTSLLKGDMQVIDISLGNIKTLVDDENFVKKLDEYTDQLQNNITKIENDAFKTIRNGPEVKNIEDITNHLNEFKEQTNEVYNEYINIIRDFITGFLKKSKKDEQ